MFLSAPRGEGGRGGAYDCYHLVQHFVRLLNLSKAILRRRRIWAHIIIALEDGLSTEIIEIIINALAELRDVSKCYSFGFVTSAMLRPEKD